MRRWSWKGPYWEPRDVWLGVYWTRETRTRGDELMLDFLSIYVCLVPCLPVRVRWYSFVHPQALGPAR